MAASKAKAAKGVQFQRGDGGSPEVFTTVLEVKKVKGPGFKKDTLETTHMDSPGFYKEFVASLRDGQSVSLECNHILGDAAQAVLLTDFDSDVVRNYKVMWPSFSNKYVIFPGFVDSYEPDNDVAGVSMLNVTIKVTGQPTWG